MSRTAARGLFGALLLVAAWEGAVRGFRLPAYTSRPIGRPVSESFSARGRPTNPARIPVSPKGYRYYVLPAFSVVLGALWEQRRALLAAGSEALAGYAIGSLAGIAAAVPLVVAPWTRRGLMPALLAVNAVPVAAYSPLVLLWLGLGASSKVATVALAVGFTVFLSTLAGFDRVDRGAAGLLRSFGAGPFSILWRLRLPTALPLIASGMRIATVRSLIVAIVTEMLGAYGGLGWIIYQAVVQIDFVQVWSAIFVASALSLGFFGLIGAAGRRIVFWR